MINSNLPSIDNIDSAEEVRSFFDTYFIEPISFPAMQIDVTVGFFEKRGFDKLASQSTAILLLQQAKIDNVNVFDLLEGLKSFDKVKLTALVSAILNANRSAISKLGSREENLSQPLEARNILI
jgi:hypothetical protein